MLAPSIKGKADFNRITFLATKGTTNDVVTVLERIAAVVNNPQVKDFNEFLKKNC